MLLKEYKKIVMHLSLSVLVVLILELRQLLSFLAQLIIMKRRVIHLQSTMQDAILVLHI